MAGNACRNYPWLRRRQVAAPCDVEVWSNQDEVALVKVAQGQMRWRRLNQFKEHTALHWSFLFHRDVLLAGASDSQMCSGAQGWRSEARNTRFDPKIF
jgi:hypothetical protein